MKICIFGFYQLRNITKYKGHMKRKSLGIVGLFVALFSIITCVSSCEVIHTYKAEVRVVNSDGVPMSGVDVTTNVDVDQAHVVYREGVTDASGRVNFEYNNVAILKVSADKGNYHGEGLLVLEEDQEVQLTVVVYN